MKKVKPQGFTLLELLIAIAVFAIMSVMTYSGLHILLDAKAQTASKSAQLEALQMTLYLLNEDLAQIAPRTVRDNYGMVESAFRSNAKDGEVLSLTRSVPQWSAYPTGSQLQRVSYRLEKGSLYRQVWTALDRTQQSQYQRRKLMDTSTVQLRFFDQQWSDYWLADSNSLRSPKAVEISLAAGDWGLVTRLFYLHP